MSGVPRGRERHGERWARTVIALMILLVGLLAAAPAGVASPSTRGIPVYAYFYQWFVKTSWSRAKIDYPLAGRYSSDDRVVLRRQITQAQAAGLTGFLTSWKSTPTLNRRLQLLLDEARPRGFDVGVVYEALDFDRRPLPIATVRHDLTELVGRWGSDLTSDAFARPVIIWTGTADYSAAAICSVRDALAGRAQLLASAKSAADYERVAACVGGDAYYWSSAHPGTSYTRSRLDALSDAVHRHGGIWLAPASPGFDGRTLHHTRVVARDHGRTLTRSLADAWSSHPDAVGVISWNEWSENTYIEPGRRYGVQELTALADYLRAKGSAQARPAVRAGQPARPGAEHGWTGLRAGIVLTAATVLGCGCALIRVRRRHL